MLTKEDIVNYFIVFLKDRYPELDLRIGTAVRDLVLEPLADLFHDFLNRLQNLENFLKGETLDEELLEKFLQNFFLERKLGTKASGLVRVYLAKNKDVRIPEGTKFYINETKWLETREGYTFLKKDLKYDSLNNRWYVEVPVEAPQFGSDYNLPKGHILEPEPFDHYVLTAETATEITGGTDKESIEDFKKRVEKALTVRNLISRRSIETVLLDRFDKVVKVYAVGFGDPEMKRDFVQDVNLHLGGCVDIYVKFTNPPKRTTVAVGADGTISIPGLLRILTHGVSVVRVDRNKSFSSFTTVALNVANTSVEVEYAPDIQEIQAYLSRSDVRPLTVDLLARCMYPVYLTGTVQVRSIKPLSDIEAQVNDWIYHLDEFSISDLVNKLYKLGVDEVKMPLVINATLILPDYTTKTIQITDRFSYQQDEFSTRTSTFYGGLKLVSF